jgi:ATP-dependent Clp protease ATP-binding subunit ClpA
VGEQEICLSISTLKHIIKEAELMQEELQVPKALENYLINLSDKKISQRMEKLSSRDEEIEKLWTHLTSLTKSNAILVGESGVGKTTMAMEVVRQINAKECPEDFLGYKVYQLNTEKLLEIENMFIYQLIINKILAFVKENKDSIILYIDDLLHMKYDIILAKVLKIFIVGYNVKIIASILIDDFNEYFAVDNSLIKHLNPILLEEPEVEEIYPMLNSKIQQLQSKYRVKMSEKMIRFAILTGLYLSSSNSSNPESTLDVINFALADARKKGQTEVSKQNILSYYSIDFKLEKKTEKEEKVITAYHEVGHYLVKKMSPHIKGTKNAFVSILPIEGALGLTASYEELGKQLTVDKEYYTDIIADLLGGRVGEALYTNSYSSGATEDLSMASSMAEQIILSYGLSSRDSEKNRSYTLGGGMYIKDFLLTDELKKEINKEISELIAEGYKRAENIINSNKKLFEDIVSALLEDGILIGDELDEICEKHSKNSIS